MEKQFSFTSEELEKQLKKCRENGITELTVHDTVISRDKPRLLSFLKAVQRDAPDVFVSIKILPSIIDMEVVRALCNIRCSIEMDFELTSRGFDKKLYAKKCALLNQTGLVFGVNLYYACPAVGTAGVAAGGVPSKNKTVFSGASAGNAGFADSLKAFRERLDFTIAQYPNHIDFPQLEADAGADGGNSAGGTQSKCLFDFSPVVSGTFSAQDIRFARDMAFACRTFYSAGRAVGWFNSVLAALRIQASAFFADFAEWQRVNNCDFKSGYIPEEEAHINIEKMQVLFLDMKLEEKHKGQLLSAVNDIVKLNGAFSRLVSEGEESTIETDYNPDDLLSPESMDIVSFANDVCMEHSTVQIFLNADGDPDYKIC